MKKNIVVTGGAQGIGKIIVRDLLSSGYYVTVLDIDGEAVAEMQKEFDEKRDDLLVLETDVAVESQVSLALEYATERFERINGLVNNAMIQANKPVLELTLEEWNQVLAVNLSGPFLCTRYAAEELKKNKGTIINMCSTRALQSEPGTEAYSASKGGLLSLTHALAMSLAPDVRVNAISPGWIDVSTIRKKSKAEQELIRPEDHAQHPAGRVGKPEDISNIVMFLIDERNSFITGQNFIVDGGMTRKMIYR